MLDLITELFTSQDEKKLLIGDSISFQSWDLTDRQLCDLELLMNGGFSPLNGFLNQDDYDSVCVNMRLADGRLWPIPVALDVSEQFAKNVSINDSIALKDKEGTILAILHIKSIWKPDKSKEAELVFGKNDLKHPAVHYLQHTANPYYIGGTVKGVSPIIHHDYADIRHTPNALRQLFHEKGWKKIVAFQTRNPLHRAHFEMTKRALLEEDARLLIHPVVGMTKPGDVDHFTRVRCYKKIIPHYPNNKAMLSLLPLAMRMAGPREALWHALIRKNYGVTDFIVGRDHAGPGSCSEGKPFYGQYDAQHLVTQHADEIGINILTFNEVVYVANKNHYKSTDEITSEDQVLNISGTEFRKRLTENLEMPHWFSFPEVIKELKKSYLPKHQQGFCIFFTGLSGAGKSTLANALQSKFFEAMSRPVTLLDGDLVRKNLSSELGFSKEHRDLSVKRIGFVAAEIVKHRGIAICAPIAPYAAIRKHVRELIEPAGGFVEIYLSTSLDACEKRDPKGFYKKARQGIIKGFTGIDDPYEIPENSELTIDTSKCSINEAVTHIFDFLVHKGYVDVMCESGEYSEKTENSLCYS